MRSVTVEQARPFSLLCDDIASDKSISHRSAMFALLSDQPSTIKNFLKAEDTLNTLHITKQLGARVKEDERGVLTITPPKTLQEPDDILDCGNSGTAIRLFCGFLSGLEGHFVLTGDKYLRRRPMKRVADPLRSIGAQIDGRNNGDLAPLSIRGKSLQPFNYESKIASAQVKSALILAALKAKGRSTVSEPHKSRDHTERMLRGMGAKLEIEGNKVGVEPMQGPLKPLELTVPTDPSSAFFFAVAAAIVPGAKVTIKDITLNKTRIGAYKVLERMGADIQYIQKEDIYEPMGDITVTYSDGLKGVEVSENISWLIDELPALAIAMAVAQGTSSVRNAEELRVKESDRIATVVAGLQRCGVEVAECEDGYDITGGELKSAVIDSHGDHRIAMSFAVGGLLCGMRIEDTECIDTSFPNFFEILGRVTAVKEA